MASPQSRKRSALPPTQLRSDHAARHYPIAGIAVGVVVVSSIVLATALARTPERDLTAGLATGGSIVVSPDGQPGGDGTIAHPIDLLTALSDKGPAKPGDTIWLRGGTYSGVYRSDLAGTEQQPIVVRPYPGEHAALDGAPSPEPVLSVYGQWTVYRDLEIFNSSDGRVSADPDSSQPRDLTRGPGIAAHGPMTKFVNLVVHDLAGGLDIWADAVGAEAYGNTIFDNGWKSGDRANGHGIYTQNREGVRRLTDNIIFNQYATGIHAYGSAEAYLDNMELEGNVLFNNGTLGGRYDRNILIGGGRVAHHPVLVGNHAFYSSGREFRSGQNNVGYLAGCTDLDAHDNYFTAGDFGFALEMVNCNGTMRNNLFVGELRAVEEKTLVAAAALKQRYPDNTYIDQPRDAQVFVRPNRWQQGRAHVIVYNPAKHERVSVDLSSAGLKNGDRFQLIDVQNYFDDPIVSDVYTGAPVSVPVSGLSPAVPIGDDVRTPPHTAPEFVVLLLTPAPVSESWLTRARASLGGLFK